MNKNFTIVTICYERRVFLRRYIEFSEMHGISTILVDGSKEAYTDFIPSNIRYYHLPKLDSWQRLRLAIDNVTTDNVVIQADDDFLMPSSLFEAADFLDRNPDYGSIQGQMYCFNELYRNSQINYYTYKVLDVENNLASDDIRERVLNHLGNYIFTFYSMKKTVIWKRFFDVFYENLKDSSVFNIRYPAVFELTQSAHTLMSGKHKMLDSPWLLREKLPNAVGFNEAKKRNFRFTGTETFSNYCDELSILSRQCFETIEQDYRALFIDGFEAYERSVIKLVHEGFMREVPDIELNFVYKQGEFKAIQSLIDKYRVDVIFMVKGDDLTLVNYCYDSNWVEDIAEKYAVLAQDLPDYLFYGAGIHTKKLIDTVGKVGNLVGIVDSNRQLWGKEMHGLQCYSPREILSLSNNVIISSQEYESDIVTSLTAVFSDKINIIRLYS